MHVHNKCKDMVGSGPEAMASTSQLILRYLPLQIWRHVDLDQTDQGLQATCMV